MGFNFETIMQVCILAMCKIRYRQTDMEHRHMTPRSVPLATRMAKIGWFLPIMKVW